MKIVQIGTGGWGKNHARILSELGALTAICDSDSNKSKEYAEKYSVKNFQSIDEMLASEEFDGAIIATPTSTHVDIAKKLLEAKKHVFVEKPMTYKTEDGELLAKLAQKNKVILTCGYIERFNPAVGTVKKIIDEKIITWCNHLALMQKLLQRDLRDIQLLSCSLGSDTCPVMRRLYRQPFDPGNLPFRLESTRIVEVLCKTGFCHQARRKHLISEYHAEVSQNQFLKYDPLPRIQLLPGDPVLCGTNILRGGDSSARKHRPPCNQCRGSE